MAKSSNQKRISNLATVKQRLAEHPYGFDFFQAVRLLEWDAVRANPSSTTFRGIGGDARPSEEPVRICATASHSFPPGPVESFHDNEAAPASGGLTQVPDRMIVSFMGMTGPSGVLPRHYTQIVIDRIRDKDYALQDFLDVFNHRMISLFYRAWTKYRLPISFERNSLYASTADQDDQITHCFRSLVGWGTDGIANRQIISDDAQIYYGGLFANQQRSAVSLERMLADYFSVNTEIVQLVGQWLYLTTDNQSRLGELSFGQDANNQLGATAVVGERVWGVENNFRVRIGPLTYPQFIEFSPIGPKLAALAQLTRSYVGMEYDFQVQLVLRQDEVPDCVLGANPIPSRLGWNTWLHCGKFDRDADDAVFACEGIPSA
ncbi:MAG: type VI secretion system baseplate subunit TssG [Planctomycetales bacterium]|nr:type VI secretion system baseplate subunit TssG [Planctomycetales bacterium]